MITTTNSATNPLIRSELWSQRIQEELQEELMAQALVPWVTDFPDGDQLTIPVLSHLSTRDYTEGEDITVDDPTVTEFTLTIDKYVQSGISVTDKMKQDAYYINILNSKFPEQVMRAIKERLESDIMLLHKGQTSNDANTINGQAHRYVGTGASNVITLKDVAQAKLSLDKANVSKAGRVAIVDPTVSYQLCQIDNVIRQDTYGANSVIRDGFGTTTRIGTYLGFEFYESNMLDEATALNHVTGGALKANLFLGNEAFIGAMRLQPEVETSRDWARKRDVYHVTSRYGLKLYRPAALVTVLTS